MSSLISSPIGSVLVGIKIVEKTFYCKTHCFRNNSCIIFIKITVSKTGHLLKTSEINEQNIK
jgi:hypothetical protein